MSTTGMSNCSQCGAPLEANVRACKYCGGEVQIKQVQGTQYPQNQGGYGQPQGGQYGQPQGGQYGQPQGGQYGQPQGGQYGQPQGGQYGQPQAAQYIPPQAPQYILHQETVYVKRKSKVVAGLLAIFLGAFGIHKFYLGKPWQGILYLLFCWTYIPGIIGFIEGIVYLLSNEDRFHAKYDKMIN